MDTKKIFTINSVDIVVTDDNNVPIKPICEALGVDYSDQLKKLKEEEDLYSTMVLSTIVAADGKQREMVCLPHQFIYGWLFTINPKNVKQEAKEPVRKYRMECFNALYEYFNGRQERRNEQDNMERSLVAERDAIYEQESNMKAQLAIIKKMGIEVDRKIDRIRQDRISNEPTLFD